MEFTNASYVGVLRIKVGRDKPAGNSRGFQDRYVSVSVQAGRVNYIPGSAIPFLSFLHAGTHYATRGEARLGGQ